MTNVRIEPEEKITLNTLEALKVYFDPMRQKIIQEVAIEPKSVREIADALDVPFTRLYYHIKMLEKHSIIRLVDTVSMSGAIEEKYYQVAARHFVVDRSLLTVVDDDNNMPGLDMAIATLVDETMDELRVAARDQLIDMQAESPDPNALLLRRGVFRLREEDAESLHRELLDLLARYHDRTAGKEDQTYALMVSVFPTGLTTNEDADEIELDEDA